ncbi:MAG: hypothetical protein DKM50_05450 [Candidatus Margulisiibacteriota bacterium]|nr:MAG: hypothetical protein A2X43_02860 [Candidatus Margulisbacteria bacterium GWD2_39_127]PZM80211.1 MAG: hypothetical protein DKM50_05450 [Candidatus Margulisiibacteriota bacterium]HAR64137.1 hypothetical protein [Candidatus Margulisiibacteriota bacterium]HCY36920.1 hypothetical protein [Candidatus Margulisiibacteriota bacterium]
MDIGCGVYPKVELGLHYTGFTGELSMVDIAPSILVKAVSFLDYINAKFKVTAIANTLWELNCKPFNIITANHFLDDLVIENHCTTFGIELRNVYHNEKLLASLWDNILLEPDAAYSLMDRFAERLDSLLNNDGIIVLADYPSYYYQTKGLLKVIVFLEKLQKYLQGSLSKKRYKNITLFREKKLKYGWLEISPDNCLCMKKPCIKDRQA